MADTKGFQDAISDTIKTNTASNKNESFEDLIRVMSGVLVDEKFKKNYISILNRNAAKGVIMAIAKIQYLESKYPHVKRPIYEPVKDEKGKDTGLLKIIGYKVEPFDTSTLKTIVNQALVTFPAIQGKRSEQIKEMMQNNIEQVSQTHAIGKLFGSGMLRR